MADIRAPDHELAEKDYMLGMKYKDIAEKYGVSINTVKSWKQRYNWNRKGVHTKTKKGAHKKKKLSTKKEKQVIEELENAELTERQRLFCLYYIKSFNATMSAIKAGYSKESAHVIGHENLRKPKIAAEIRRLKGTMTNELFIDAMDVLNKYIKIAFADITEYVKFGQKEVPVMTMFGPMKDEDGNEVTKIVNYVDFNESTMIDGSIIKEVKQGKEGVSIKFEDKMKALDKLSLYFDLFPDKFKRKIEEEKVKIQQDKLELEKEKVKKDDKDKNIKITIVDDIEGEEDEN